jgi:hypothetical protein
MPGSIGSAPSVPIEVRESALRASGARVCIVPSWTAHIRRSRQYHPTLFYVIQHRPVLCKSEESEEERSRIGSDTDVVLRRFDAYTVESQ